LFVTYLKYHQWYECVTAGWAARTGGHWPHCVSHMIDRSAWHMVVFTSIMPDS